MTGHTATEKILAKKAGKKEVFPGDIVTCDVDLVFVHSPWQPIPVWDDIGEVERVFDGDLVAFGLGHHVCLPASQDYATDLVHSREWAKKYGVKHVYDMGTGNAHIIMLEKGHVWPGAICVGADSHSTIYGALGAYGTCLTYEVSELLLSGKTWFKVPSTIRVTMDSTTRKGVTARDIGQYLVKEIGGDGANWKTLDFAGSYIHSLSIYQRMIFSLLAVEMGANTGFIEPDEITMDFLRGRARRSFEVVTNDPDCTYEREIHLDVSKFEPLIGCPPRPSNTRPVSEVEGTRIDQAYLGGCTGSGVEDFRMAAEILKGRRLNPSTRLLVVPGTQEIMKQMRQEGLLQFFEELGAVISAPYCGPCQMMCYGYLGEGETMIGTHPRNLPGRAGKNVDIYLGSPYSVAAAAVTGKITDPRIFL